MARKRKRGLVVSDLHCGAENGLTHLGFDSEKTRVKETQSYAMRRFMWDWTQSTIKPLGKFDFVILNGDAIDGKGDKTGGTEQLYTDRNEQVDMAVAFINTLRYDKLFMSYGTSYHTGRLEDWEDAIAREVKAEKIGGEDNLRVNGVTINYRHHVGRSTIPHGRHTAPAREAMWNKLWAQRGEYPQADIIIRSHVHYYTYCGGRGWVAMTTPALQGYGGKYGGRIMSGTVDFGFVFFDIYGKEDYSWEAPILTMPYHAPLELEGA